MRLAMRLPAQKGPDGVANDVDPRDEGTPDVTDLANRVSYPAVANRKTRSDGMGLAAGVLIVAALGAVTLWSMNAARVEPQQGIGGEVQPGPAPDAMPYVPPEAVTVVQPVETLAAAPQPVGMPPPVTAYAPAQQAQPSGNRYASPTVVFDAGAMPVGIVPSGEAAAAGEGTAAAGGSANDFASRIGGVGGAPAQARAMVNPQTTVTQGTLIPAILETAIDTNVPGYVRAVVSQDVRSFDGSRVLVPRSSRLIGQYQSGMQGGQKRAYVIWTRLIRPDGASVQLASPAIGFDGTTGLQGKVSGNGFFKRFGSAMLLSVVGGLSTIASGGASVVLGGAGSSAAATAAEQDGQRSPTVRVRQGEPIRIFTARDLDFSQVSG